MPIYQVIKRIILNGSTMEKDERFEADESEDLLDLIHEELIFEVKEEEQ